MRPTAADPCWLGAWIRFPLTVSRYTRARRSRLIGSIEFVGFVWVFFALDPNRDRKTSRGSPAWAAMIMYREAVAPLFQDPNKVVGRIVIGRCKRITVDGQRTHASDEEGSRTATGNLINSTPSLRRVSSSWMVLTPRMLRGSFTP